MKGTVYLIGAGPGDPELITRKGYKRLMEADCVFIDRLAPDALLEELEASTEVIDCGKQPHGHRLSQDEINERLADKANSGNTVARIKGGDPMVFGRGGEEYRYLKKRGVAVEIIPGVTAATAASSRLGAALTDRTVASEVTFLTGHEAPGKGADELDWDCMANCRKTLVVYMGVSRMEAICDRLIEHGRDPGTPAAVVESATRETERVVEGDLASIGEKSRRRGVQPPALLVIGEVLDQTEEKRETSLSLNPEVLRCFYNGEILV